MIYNPPDTGVLKSRIMRWARCKMCPEFLWGGQEEWNNLEGNSVNNRTVLKWVIKENGGGGEHGLDSFG
jgi:hypothetical protein